MDHKVDYIVGIRYVEAGPISYCSPGDLNLGTGDYVVITTDRGERLGWVVLTPDQVIAGRPDGPLRVIDRLASAQEVEAHREAKRRAEEDITRAQAIAARIDSRVRVASLTYDLTGAFAEATYTAREGVGDVADRLRREFQRDFGGEFAVEQVGDRDRAKAVGGLGQCGRGLCCSTWMTEFPAISIKMAKDQGLAPNPSKISGACGRLLCCLSFEVEAYREIIGTLPKVGKRITTPVGRAKVLSINALTEMVRLRFDESGEVVEMSTAALRGQMGTAVRPEELEGIVEGPIHEEDRQRREHFIAVLDPIARPLRDTEEVPGLERRAPRPRPDGARSEGGRRRTADATALGTPGAPTADGAATGQRRRTRRGGSRRTEGATGLGAQPSARPSGEQAPGEQHSGVRITRRRRPDGGTGTGPTAEGITVTPRAERTSQPSAERTSQPRPSQPPRTSEGGDGGGSEEEKRKRRRGRRGGRRRTGSGQAPEGGTQASE